MERVSDHKQLWGSNYFPGGKKWLCWFCLKAQNFFGKPLARSWPHVAGSHPCWQTSPSSGEGEVTGKTSASPGSHILGPCLYTLLAERKRKKATKSAFHGQKANLMFQSLQFQYWYSLLTLQNSESRKTCNLPQPLFAWGRDKLESYFFFSLHQAAQLISVISVSEIHLSGNKNFLFSHKSILGKHHWPPTCRDALLGKLLSLFSLHFVIWSQSMGGIFC